MDPYSKYCCLALMSVGGKPGALPVVSIQYLLIIIIVVVIVSDPSHF